jgi:hypothetical protein
LINSPIQFLDFNNTNVSEKGSILLKEWAKYRYGVFEENGFPGDLLYPEMYSEGNATLNSTGCIENGTIFCPLTSSYNKNALTKQNILCNTQSAMEIIMDSTDFKDKSISNIRPTS